MLAIYNNTHKTMTYMKWQLYITLVLVVLPLLAMIILIPLVMKSLGTLGGIYGGEMLGLQGRRPGEFLRIWFRNIPPRSHEARCSQNARNPMPPRNSGSAALAKLAMMTGSAVPRRRRCGSCVTASAAPASSSIRTATAAR